MRKSSGSSPVERDERIEAAISRAIKRHDGAYDYSKVTYARQQDKVVITCETHGDFTQAWHSHLAGSGCPDCSRLSMAAKKRIDPEEARDRFIRKAREVHGDRYDYTKVDYTGKGMRDKVTIICPDYGEFEQTYGNHVTLGHGSPARLTCDRFQQEKTERRDGTVEDRRRIFLLVSRRVHGGEYEYPNIETEFKGYRSQVTVVCPKCGPGLQWAHNHMRGHGCRTCNSSRMEKQIARWLARLLPNEPILLRDRSLIDGEIDIYLPDRKLAVEFGGTYYHQSDKVGPSYHARKQKMCAAKGVTLVTLFDFDWADTVKRRIIRSSLRSRLGLVSKRIAARKCQVGEVSAGRSRRFQEKNHLQGWSVSAVNLGLFHEGKLVALLTMGRPRFSTDHEWEIIRFCSRRSLVVQGAFSRLLAHFHRTHSPGSIITYANLRWGEGRVYEASGFSYVKRTAPAAWYCNASSPETPPLSRMAVQRHRLPKLLKRFDSDLSASENLRRNHYVILHDCGCNVYEWRSP